jgi:hypothetical protein
MEMYWSPEGNLQFRVHLKENQVLKYLNRGSTHTDACFAAIPTGVMKRLASLTTRTEKSELMTMDKLYPAHASGDADSLKVTCQMAHYPSPIVSGLDERSPIVASHSLVAAGYENVINLVIDNYAQWFSHARSSQSRPRTHQLKYHNFLTMGIPPSQLQLTGHWIPRELVDNIPTTCQWWIQRRVDSKPVRIC